MDAFLLSMTQEAMLFCVLLAGLAVFAVLIGIQYRSDEKIKRDLEMTVAEGNGLETFIPMGRASE